MLALALDNVASDLMRGDGNLELRARDTLDQHPHFRGRAGLFQYECCGDALIVRGTVPTFYLKQLLQTALKGFEDVVRIHNQVIVTSWDSISTTSLEPVGI
jgi:hypothetical protein